MRKLIINTEQELATELLINLGNYVLNVGDFNLSPTV